jgi:hypothetical protein
MKKLLFLSLGISLLITSPVKAECRAIDWKETNKEYILEVYKKVDNTSNKLDLKKYACYIYGEKSQGNDNTSEYISVTIYHCSDTIALMKTYYRNGTVIELYEQAINNIGSKYKSNYYKSITNWELIDKTGKEFSLEKVDNPYQESYTNIYNESCTNQTIISTDTLRFSEYDNAPTNIRFEFYEYQYYKGVPKPQPQF